MTDIAHRLGAELRDRYRVEREIGRGGMAVVYLAEDLRHRRRVAIKVLSPEIAPVLGAERFLREIEIAARLSHPHILPLHDSGEADGLLFYVMPYVEGETLRDRLLREKQLPVDEALRIAHEVADALGYAHTMGLVHRDIKPENILFQAGHAVVSDFGIARAVSAAGGTLTGSGMAVGTVLYMSPEQAAGVRDVDARSDVYSLGCVLYEMLAGEAPFGAVATDGTLSALRASRESVLPSVERVLARALARTPADRFATGAQFADALAQAVTGPGPAAPPATRRRPAVRLAVPAFVAVIAVAAGLAWKAGVLGAAPIRSIAVLPVRDLSGDSAQAYFVEGMHDALIAELAGIGALRVISRTSMQRYRNTTRSIPEIAQELRVDALVEASAERSGDSVRLRIHLIRARPAERDLWAATFDRDLRHVVALHRDIARAIARRISASLSPEEERRLAASREVDPDAYDAYLRGMFILHSAENATDFQRGLAHLQEAIARDSTEPLPWAGLALGYDQIGHLSAELPDAFARAKAAAARAQALGGDLGETEAALAQTLLYYDWDLPAAEEAFRRAIALNSSIPDAHSHYGWLLLALGRTDEALAALRRAEDVDPLTPLWPVFTGSAALWGRRQEEARAGIDRALALNPDFPIGLWVQAEVLAVDGRFADAVTAARRAVTGSPAWRFGLAWALIGAGQRDEALRIAGDLRRDPSALDQWGLAEVYAALGDTDEAMRWLEAAYRSRWSWMLWMDFNPAFEPIRGDPRFIDLMRRVGAPRCQACPAARPGA
jgi:serine/threonine-protein kinase